MNYEAFTKSLHAEVPPNGISPYLKALWFEAKLDWEKAHEIVQDLETPAASWIHAYLHRKEGDNANAGYWYRRAGKQLPSLTLEREWEEIVKALL